MASIVICGGGPIGLACALLLGRDGHQVTVLEADRAEPPGDLRAAWESWERRGVPQFRQPHNVLPGFWRIAERESPEVIDLLTESGCAWADLLYPMPSTIADQARRPGDDRFRFMPVRRAVLESALALAAARRAGVTVRRGVRVTGLLGAPAAVPAVTGVRTSGGEEIRADLVVDAMGRGTPSSAWLTALGSVGPRIEAAEHGFAYYTRHFTGPRQPVRMAPPYSQMGTFALLTIPGGHDTWSVTFVAGRGDAPLKDLRDPERFARVLRACPAHAHWGAGTPVTGVLAMAGVLDRRRRFTSAGRPVATGFAAVGDASACTAPTAARGLSTGLIQAQALRDLVRDRTPGGLGGTGFATAWEEATERLIGPYYADQIATDRARAAEMAALRQGQSPPPRPDPEMARLEAAATHDPDAFRALAEATTCLTTPQDVLSRPSLAALLDRLPPSTPRPLPAPTRGALLTLLTDAPAPTALH
ncbi:FAD-dependent oxidoreductase [Spongiactinospora rosea]|uniref:FAD-dependent oxidoreductase n=1 Tax=Spongiactinospora rosea TaxID=2248750 RepID=A0A366LRZ5_9ACTN|nr:FAD-dependent monooxygenase [Spongiactinospora rosea]RBQ16390.1 FAD-dependent oxidoreductase [Spongiactinospora rosea]